MSGTIPKSEVYKEKPKNPSDAGKEKEIKEEQDTGHVSPLQLSQDAHSAQLLNGGEDHEEQEDDEEEEVEEAEEPLPNGWSEGVDGNGVRFYWYIRDGRVSFDRPRREEATTDREDGSIHSHAQTARSNESHLSTTRSQKTQGGATPDRKKNQVVDEFEKLLREQMFTRQLKEVLQLADKELLRAVIVRYEDSAEPPGERRRNDDDDDDDDDDERRERRDLSDAKELLETIDYYYYLLKGQVLRGHWLQLLTTAAAVGAGEGKGQRGGGGGTRGRGGRGTGGERETRESRFHKLMDKFDRLSSQGKGSEEREYENERWMRGVERDGVLRRGDVLQDIVALLARLRRKPDPRRPGPKRTKGGPTKGGPSHHGRYEQDEMDDDDDEAEMLRDELLRLKRVRQFLHQHMEYVEALGHALRPRDTSLPILAMDKKTMAEIRSYASPKPIVHRVMQAALLLIGYDEATTAVWSNCKSACVPDGRDGLNRRLMKFNVDDLDPFVVKRSWRILSRIRLEDVQKASPGAATFYVWASGVLRMHGYSIDDDVSEGGSNDVRMTQRELVRRDQETLRDPAMTSHNEEFSDERLNNNNYYGAIYKP